MSVEGVKVVSEAGVQSFVPCIPGKTSDGYHTFDELYEHRCLLYLAFLWYHADHCGGWRSWLHHNGTSFDGWFVCGCEINGQQVTYHLPARLWDSAWWLREYDHAPVEWDGHTSNDVLDRLKGLFKKS